jgi:O-antigen ligase
LKPQDAAMTGDARWTALFDRIALFLTLLGFLLREWIPGSTAGAGLNLFIPLLFWIALTLWFAGRATGSGGDYRFTGFEFAFLAFAGVALLSVLRASYKLAALDSALTWLSLALFFVLCIQLLGRAFLLSILLATLFTVSVYAAIQFFVLFPLLPASAAGDSIEMVRRIRTNEVFASFIGPNQLAGFLVLLLPPLAGSMIDTREYWRRGAALALGLVALFLTGSLGGEVALVCGAATLAGLALTRTRGRALAVGIGAGAVAVAVALLLWSPLLSAVGRHSHSMHVRAVYWRATGPMIASAPLLGVGFNNWEEHYFATKSDVQQETKKAHNDYLQVLSELGIVGLLSLAGILILGLRKALAREAAPEAGPPPPSPALPAVLIALLVLLGCLQAADVVGTTLSILLGGSWLAFWWMLRRDAEPADLTWTRMGAAGGLVALLVHMVVDFQLYENGVSTALVAALALIALLRGGSTSVRLPRPVCIGATAILLALTIPLLVWVAPRAMAADNEIEDARMALASLEAGTSANPTRLISDAIRVSESAQAHNPFNPEAYQLFARAKFHEWDLLQKAGAREGRTLEESEGMVLQSLENALALRPLSSPLHYEKSQAHRIFRRYYLKTGKTAEMAAAKASEHLRLALLHQRRAYDLYPTWSRNAYLLARLLEISGDLEAPKYYREALRLSDLAGRELEDLDRLKIGEIAQARALRAVAKPLDARDVLDRYFRAAVRGLTPEDAKARLERMLKASEEELDEGMTPVLKDSVEAILRDLK